MKTTIVRAPRIAHSEYLDRVIATYRTFSVIDRKFPKPRYERENDAYSHEVAVILGDAALSSGEKVDALLSLIGRL